MKQINFDEAILDTLADDGLVDEYNGIDISTLPKELAEEIKTLQKEERANNIKNAAKYVVKIMVSAEMLVSKKRSSLAELRVNEKRIKSQIFDILVAKQYAINTSDYRPLLALVDNKDVDSKDVNYKNQIEKAKAVEQVKEFLADKAKVKPKVKTK